jgi:hypothetical protein
VGRKKRSICRSNEQTGFGKKKRTRAPEIGECKASSNGLANLHWACKNYGNNKKKLRWEHKAQQIVYSSQHYNICTIIRRCKSSSCENMPPCLNILMY